MLARTVTCFELGFVPLFRLVCTYAMYLVSAFILTFDTYIIRQYSVCQSRHIRLSCRPWHAVVGSAWAKHCVSNENVGEDNGKMLALDAETIALIAVKVHTDSYLHERNFRELTVVWCKLLASAKNLSLQSLGEMFLTALIAELISTVDWSRFSVMLTVFLMKLFRVLYKTVVCVSLLQVSIPVLSCWRRWILNIGAA